MNAPNPPPQLTPLHALHLARGANMTQFANYAMPLHYPAGIIKEHLHTRASASLFDVSHMGQIEARGRDIDALAAALESLMPADLLDLPNGAQCYALLTDELGGIIDDLMAQRLGGRFVLIVNARRKRDDLNYLRGALKSHGVQVELLQDRALLALQGPAAAAALAGCIDGGGGDLDDFKFMRVREFTVAGVDCIVSRSGYTGEDGFELSVANADAAALAERLLSDARVELAGLGARDSLRVEAGLCLHGSDIAVTTTPGEAGLNWAVARARRPGGMRPGGFPGAGIIDQKMRSCIGIRRVGLLPAGRAPVRGGAFLFVESDAADGASMAGSVTSGVFSPTLRRPVAMGYVGRENRGVGNRLYAAVRDKRIEVTVVKLPFVAHRYHR